MIRYNVGDIIIVFEGTKKRPVVIINNGLGIDIDMSTVRITSKKPRNKFDIEIKNWKEAGLDKPSVVRCSKINTISVGQQLLKVGRLEPEDLERVKDGVKGYITQGFEV